MKNGSRKIEERAQRAATTPGKRTWSPPHVIHGEVVLETEDLLDDLKFGHRWFAAS